MASQQDLAIQMFGSFEVRAGGLPLKPTRTRKERLLLALLTLQNGRPLSRDSAAALLWPDSTPSQRLGNLRRSLMNLRQVLGPEGERLSIGAGDLRLDLSGAYVDVLDFDHWAAGKTEEALRKAVALYRGGLLAEWDADWVIAARLSRLSACTSAIHRLIPYLAPPEAIHYLRHAVAIDPMGEASLRELMSLLAHGGDRQGAMEAYRAHESKLRRQFGWGVAPETTALFDRIRSADQAVPARGPSPPEKAPLVGRQGELLWLRSGLAGSRLVTITGPPGVGKSRLAAELVAEASSQFRDGCLHVPMHEEDDLIGRLGELFGGEGTENFLAGREVLLWIDGVGLASDRLCEDLTRIRQVGPGVHCLLTIWQPTELPGERHLVLEPLAPSDSAQLFESRARHVIPGFALTASNLGEVEALCRDLEGLPLTIEIAAAWMSTLTLTHIGELFARVGAHDESLEQVLPSRRRSLRDALDSCIEVLTEPERKTLLAIAAFPDGCSLHALMECTGFEFVGLSLVLQRLVAVSLVRFDPGAGRYGMLKVVRGHCLDRLSEDERERRVATAAEYLWGLVSRGLADGDTLFDDYADRWLLSERENFRFFVEWWRTRDSSRSVIAEFAMVAYQVWQPPDVRTWIARFGSDEDFPPGTEPFVRYMIGIFALWQQHPDRRGLLETALATATRLGAPLWEAATYTGLSVLAEVDKDYAEVVRCEAAVQRAAKAAGTVYYPEHSLGIQTLYEHYLGDEAARVRALEQLNRGDVRNDWRIRYAALRGLAGIALWEKDFAALASWSQELVSLSAVHCRHELTHVLAWQIRAAIECGDFASAHEWAEQSIKIARERKTHDREASARMLVADLAEREGKMADAERELVQAGQIYESISDFRKFSVCLIRRAGFAEARHRREEFGRLVRWAKALADARGFSLGEPYSGILDGMLARA